MRTNIAIGLILPSLIISATQSQPNQPNRPNQPNQPGQPGQPIQPGRNQPTNAASATSVVRQLEGVWRVEVKVNPSLFMEQAGQKDGMSPSRTNPRPDRPGNEAPGTTRDTDHAKDMSKTCSGYAVSDLIMGDQILRQSLVSYDMGKLSGHDGMSQPGNRNDPNSPSRDRNDPNSPSRNPNDPNAPGKDRDNRDAKADLTTGSRAFTGLSFISFDPQRDQYQAVFMDSRTGEIESRSGTFDATGSRIVFEDGTSNYGTSPSDQNRSMRDAARQNVRVVVEILSNDRYRVTMHKIGATGTPSPSTDRNNPTPASPTTGTNLDKDVVYEATYTRASATEEQTIRDLVDRNLGREGRSSTGMRPMDTTKPGK
ncbi:MAG: DUF1579 family protein [Phycisphaerales bacterium]